MLPTTLRAARLHAYGPPLRIHERPAPRPGPGQLLGRERGAGVRHGRLTANLLESHPREGHPREGHPRAAITGGSHPLEHGRVCGRAGPTP